MDDQQRRAAATEQLTAAGTAHSVYERDVLHGEYDQQWAEWYADYLIQNNWNDLFTSPWDVNRLAAALRESDAEHRKLEPNARWQEFYAARLVR
jgi:hypothetical protein